MEPNHCKICGVLKLTGKGRVCAACRRASGYDRKYFKTHVDEKSASAAQRKRSLLEWYRKQKEGKACGICGGVFPVACMDYDHLPGHKKFMEVSRMTRLGYEKEKIIAEIAKCQLLCANCHRILTVKRRQRGPVAS